MKSKKLTRQLKKAFQDESIDETLKELLQNSSDPKLQIFAEQFQEFLASTDSNYEQSDKLLERAVRNLEISSKELSDSNAALYDVNIKMTNMLNSLGQAFFLFDAEGICDSFFSKATELMFGFKPAGLHLAFLLGYGGDRETGLRDWIDLLFLRQDDFAELVKLGPTHFNTEDGRYIELQYRALRNDQDELQKIVVIGTDLTDSRRAQRQAEYLLSYSEMLVRIIQDKSGFSRFLETSKDIVSEIESAVHADADQCAISKKVRRDIHSLKGIAASYHATNLSGLCHEIEGEVQNESDPSKIIELIDARAAELRAAHETLVGLTREILQEDLSSFKSKRQIPLKIVAEFYVHLRENIKVDDFTRDYYFRNFLAMPSPAVFRQFDIMLQDLGKSLGKKFEKILFEPPDFALLPEPYTGLLESFVHVIRNIADHGIEPAGERLAVGKGEAGTIKISFEESQPTDAHRLLMKVQDDGRGINVSALKRKLKETGRQSMFEGKTEDQILQVIFESQVSTAEQVTALSGRGVGMEAVKSAAEKLGGKVWVESTPGKGTTLNFDLPYFNDLDSSFLLAPLPLKVLEE